MQSLQPDEGIDAPNASEQFIDAVQIGINPDDAMVCEERHDFVQKDVRPRVAGCDRKLVGVRALCEERREDSRRSRAGRPGCGIGAAGVAHPPLAGSRRPFFTTRVSWKLRACSVATSGSSTSPESRKITISPRLSRNAALQFALAAVLSINALRAVGILVNDFAGSNGRAVGDNQHVTIERNTQKCDIYGSSDVAAIVEVANNYATRA